MSLLLGLIGHPVKHSLSPAMHRAALNYYGLAGEYRLVDLAPEELRAGLRSLIAERFAGFNVTVPHKQAIFALVQENSNQARALGAVNTVKVNHGEGELFGHNTDLEGFTTALSEAMPEQFTSRAACVIGSGGAARAALWGLARLGFRELLVVSRNPAAAQALVRDFEHHHKRPGRPSLRLMGIENTHPVPRLGLVVNSTPIGLNDEAAPDWALRLLKQTDGAGLCFDMVYARSERPTSFVSAARDLGLTGLDGTEMLVQQAALSFSYWTGKKGPVEVMRQALWECRRGGPG